jgi:GT2 family glycosyltransferase/2-polyprenyl-3-methyl-5-hydroxy-6-metoxy-1,4-benzoquinol methylase
MTVTAADVAVVIPTRDRWPILARTLEALAGQSLSGFEVVVVGDGRDQTVPDLAATVVVKEHGGPGAARNAGVAATDRSVILLLGDDMIPVPDLVERHVSRHAAEPDDQVAVLGRVDWHPEVRGSRLLRWLDWSQTQFDYDNISGDGTGFGRFYSCNVSLKRALLEQVGGFDEAFTYYYEDLDLGKRLDDNGMVLRYEPAARAQHLHTYDLQRIQGRFRGIATGEAMMAAKHPWFTPFFHDRCRAALSHPPVHRAWAVLADIGGARPAKASKWLRRRANRWWYQQVGDAFFDVWEGERGHAELRAYLGDDYDDRKFREHMHEVDAEEHAAPDELTFYRTSTAYLYDLTVFAMTGTKTPYLRAMREHVAPGARLLDYGCGIGSDGLRLLDLGYEVSFADFDNPSVQFLRWRLQQRGRTAEIFDVEKNDPTGFDAVYCFDVIEHVPDPFAFLERLERTAGIVVVNFLEPAERDVHVHKPLPVDALMERIRTQHRLLHHQRYHGRSHLAIYRVRR